ncbi:L-lactate dehydrogenase, partial [bacterium]|nr:L-lactate dehydrogenase [bacterium]
VDAITFFAQKASGLPFNQVFGTGTLLDSLRLRGCIQKKLSIAEESIHAYMLGEHGDSQFAAWSAAYIAGIPLQNFPTISDDDLHQFSTEARQKAYDIIKYKGSTFFGIATCVATLCQAIIFNQKIIIPLSIFVEKFKIYISLPIVLGNKGIEKIIDIPLNKLEKKQLELSIKTIQEMINMT